MAKNSTAPSNYTGRCKVVIFDFPSRNLYELPEMGLIKSWFCSSKDIITAYVSKIKQGVLGCITLIFNVLLENVIIWVIMKLFLKKKDHDDLRETYLFYKNEVSRAYVTLIKFITIQMSVM